MTKYSFAQLEQLWIANGGNAATSIIAAAIAMAESGGDSNAAGHNPGSTDVGLWQINGPGSGNAAFYDPNANAKEAIRQSNNGLNWHPWCTAYTDGACGTKGGMYAPFGNSPSGKEFKSNGAGSGGSQGGLLPTAPTLSNPFDPKTWLSGFLALIGVPDLKDMAERLGFILLGAALVFIGLKILGSSLNQKVTAPVTRALGGGEEESQDSGGARRQQKQAAVKAVASSTGVGRAAEMAVNA